MSGMQITDTHEFPQSVEAAFAMLTDPEFLDAVCAASDPIEYWVFADGQHTGARRVMRGHASIKKFTGPTITVTDEIDWDAEPAGDTRTGAAKVTVEGMPVALVGRVVLAPHDSGSALTYSGTLKVSIPVVGPSLERQAAPILLNALAIQAQVAQTWA
jgi:hypothetical protein